MSIETDRLALLGGPPVHRAAAPPYPVVAETTKARVTELLDRGPMLGLGKGHPAIGECEAALARYHGVPHCLGTSTGHGALHAALIGLELTAGAEVLTSPYSWGVSVAAILHNNGVPRFADVSPRTGLLDPASVAATINDRTAAILVPHIYGQPADMTALMAIAERYGVPVIEDASQAHGARHRGQLVGTFGHAAGFSCNGIKPIAAGEAGFLLARDAEVYWKAAVSCAHTGRAKDDLPGRIHEADFPDAYRSFFDSLTYTYRLSTIGAILVRGQLEQLDAQNAARRANAALLYAGIAGMESVHVAPADAADEPAVHMVCVSFDETVAGVDRDTFVAALRAEGVGAITYLRTPLHRLERLSPDWRGPRVMWTEPLRRAGYDPGALQLPGADRMCASSIQVPWNLVDEDPALMERFAAAFRKVEAHLPALRRHAGRAGGP